MKNICLIKPRITGFLNNKTDIPHGLLCLGSALEASGYNVKILDLTEKLYDIIPEADLYGITSYTIFYDECLKIKDWIRKNRQSKAVIVVGGPHASILYDAMVNDGFDYIFTGEGEKTFPTIIESLIDKSYSDIIIKGECVDNIDEYVLNYQLVDPDFYTRGTNNDKTISIISSRGCPYQCAFCWTANNYRANVRYKSVKVVMSEIDEIFRLYGKRNICFLDDSFLSDQKRAFEIMDELKNREIIWECECNVPHLQNINTCRKLYDTGCRHILMGVESGSDIMLKQMNKPQTSKTIRKAVENIKATGDIVIRASIMVGFPGETWETLKESVDFLVSLNFDEYTLYTFTPFPGTDPYSNREKYGITKITDDFSNFYLIKGDAESSYSFETKNLNPAILEQMRNYVKARLDERFISSAKMNVRISKT